MSYQRDTVDYPSGAAPLSRVVGSALPLREALGCSPNPDRFTTQLRGGPFLETSWRAQPVIPIVEHPGQQQGAVAR